MQCSIGENIAKFRDNNNLTQEELAKATGYTRITIARWETGKRDIKSDDIIKLAEFFGVSCDELLTGTESKDFTVASELGLSGTAVKNLKNDKEVSRIVNILLKEDRIGFFKIIADYYSLKDVYLKGLEDYSLYEWMRYTVITALLKMIDGQGNSGLEVEFAKQAIKRVKESLEVKEEAE